MQTDNDKLVASNTDVANSYDKTAEALANLNKVKATKATSTTSTATVAKKAYADGGVDVTGGEATLHGTPSNPEVIFNSTDAAKLYSIIHNSNGNLSQYYSNSMQNHSSNLTTNNDKTVSVNIGDINLSEVENPNEIAKIIKEKLPSSVLQALYAS